MARARPGAYRFSVVLAAGAARRRRPGQPGRPRLLPTGSSTSCSATGIEPWLTLYHWDLPQALEDAGGWPARDTAAALRRVRRARRTARSATGSRHWTTLNEPWCSAFLGYASGVHAPGRRDPAARARGRPPPAARPRPGGRRRCAPRRPRRRSASRSTCTPCRPADRRPRPTSTPRAASTACRTGSSSTRCCAARYPADVRRRPRRRSTDFGHVRDGDLAIIARAARHARRQLLQPAHRARRRRGRRASTASPASVAVAGSEHVRFVHGGLPVTAMGWEIDAPGLVEVLHAGHPRLPGRCRSYVTENGAAFDDEVAAGRRRSTTRSGSPTSTPTCAPATTRSRAGVPLRGYFAWSLLDNFEWAWGYAQAVRPRPRRLRHPAPVPKASARWYAEVIRRGGFRSGLTPANPPGRRPAGRLTPDHGR